MPYQRYLAELLGAFSLTMIVWLAVVFDIPFPTPVLAAMTLGLFVYTVGGISGAHLNPAVTIAMWTAKKIQPKHAAGYVLAQFLGATIAMLLGRVLSGQSASVPLDGTAITAVAEALGAAMLAFGVMSATLQKIPAAAAGLVVGGSLLIGIYMAFPFSNAILNPAVAVGIGAAGPMYILGPIVGAIAGAWARLALENAHSVGSPE